MRGAKRASKKKEKKRRKKLVGTYVDIENLVALEARLRAELIGAIMVVLLLLWLLGLANSIIEPRNIPADGPGENKRAAITVDEEQVRPAKLLLKRKTCHLGRRRCY